MIKLLRFFVLILIIGGFSHVALVGMLFCCLIQNLAKIGQSVNEMWPKK